MPIFRTGSAYHYFAHVPKCAGQSVEEYLAKRFGALAFLDDLHRDRPSDARWSRSSPQHILAADLDRLVPNDWLQSAFAVVRHPIARFVSVYHYKLLFQRRIPLVMGPEEFLSEYVRLSPFRPYLHDNHLKLQSDFMPAGALYFKLEDGFDALAHHIDTIAGGSAPHLAIEHKNKGTPKVSEPTVATPLSNALRRRLTSLYAEDFERFGYPLDDDRDYRIERPLLSPAKHTLEHAKLARRRLLRTWLIATRGRFDARWE